MKSIDSSVVAEMCELIRMQSQVIDDDHENTLVGEITSCAEILSTQIYGNKQFWPRIRNFFETFCGSFAAIPATNTQVMQVLSCLGIPLKHGLEDCNKHFLCPNCGHEIPVTFLESSFEIGDRI